MTSYLLLLATLAPGQGNTGPGLMHFDFRKDPVNEDFLARIGPWKETVTKTPEGLHILLPEGRAKLNTVGVSSKLNIKGDFEITLAYKLVETKPMGGYGAGVMLWFMLDNSPISSYAALSHRTSPAKGEMYGTDIGFYEKTDDKVKQIQKVETFSASGKQGQLRIKREGSKLSYFVAELGSNEFRLFRVEEGFPQNPIKHTKFVADAGNSVGKLEVILQSLTIRTKEELVASTPVGETPETPSPAGSIAIIAAIAIVALLVVGCILYWWRRPAEEEEESEDESEDD
jgi:hypothetical protein